MGAENTHRALGAEKSQGPNVVELEGVKGDEISGQ